MPLPYLQSLCFEEWALLAAHVRYAREKEALQKQLSNLLANPPLDGNDSQSAKNRMEWSRSHRELQCELARIDDLFHFPLDHPRGESFKPRPASHWMRAFKAPLKD